MNLLLNDMALEQNFLWVLFWGFSR
jgi:hypothetical protein